MKILFTGASSFTGFWFVQSLLAAGHEVTATCTKDAGSYDGVRATRMSRIGDGCEIVHGTSFGDGRFIDIIRGQRQWDLLCHHGSFVGNHKDAGFDVATALASNTNNLPQVLDALKNAGCAKVMLTGSYFEAGEGGQKDDFPFSPYGLAKTFTTMCFKQQCARLGMELGHFVIPNPFGPHEDDKTRFTTYLMRQWAAGKEAEVQTPDYVRDNIHVRLLAAAYAQAAEMMQEAAALQAFRPSCYVETQGRFAQRIADEAKCRSGLECRLSMERQSSFDEPASLANTDSITAGQSEFTETELWDEFVDYHLA